MSENFKGNYEEGARGWRELAPDEEVRLSERKHLWNAEETAQRTEINGRLLTRLGAGGMRWDIYDLRYTESHDGVREITPGRRMKADYLVMDSFATFEGEEDRGFAGIVTGESVVMGRQGDNRFDYSTAVSRKHLEIRADEDGLVIINLRPSNATKIELGEKMSEEERREDVYLRENIAGGNDSAAYAAPEVLGWEETGDDRAKNQARGKKGIMGWFGKKK